MISTAKSGIIGKIKDIEIYFKKLVEGDIRELNHKEAGGSIAELSSYPLLAIVNY